MDDAWRRVGRFHGIALDQFAGLPGGEIGGEIACPAIQPVVCLRPDGGRLGCNRRQVVCPPANRPFVMILSSYVHPDLVQSRKDVRLFDKEGLLANFK